MLPWARNQPELDAHTQTHQPLSSPPDCQPLCETADSRGGDRTKDEMGNGKSETAPLSHLALGSPNRPLLLLGYRCRKSFSCSWLGFYPTKFRVSGGGKGKGRAHTHFYWVLPFSTWIQATAAPSNYSRPYVDLQWVYGHGGPQVPASALPGWEQVVLCQEGPYSGPLPTLHLQVSPVQEHLFSELGGDVHQSWAGRECGGLDLQGWKWIKSMGWHCFSIAKDSAWGITCLAAVCKYSSSAYGTRRLEKIKQVNRKN